MDNNFSLFEQRVKDANSSLISTLVSKTAPHSSSSTKRDPIILSGARKHFQESQNIAMLSETVRLTVTR